MSSTDDTFFENGVHQWNDETQFNDKQWVYNLDQNSGVYSSGQVQFDLSSLSNSKGYYNWSEGYAVLPLVYTVTSSTVLAQTDFAAALKNGFYQLINAASIKIGNNDVNNRTEFTNLHINYKVMTSLSYNDLINLGPSIGVYPDSALSGQYGAAGLKNNVVNFLSSNAAAAVAGGAAVPAVNAVNFYNTNGAYVPSRFNEGLYRRSLLTAFNPATGGSGLVEAAQLISNYRNYTVNNTAGAAGAANSPTQVYFVQALIRLKDIHDVFAKMNMPISGAYIRLILNLNVGSSIVSIVDKTNNSLTRVTSTNVTGQTFPIMLTDAVTDKPTVGGNTMTVAVGIGKVGNFANNFGSCRIYVPLYQMNPAFEAKYLQEGTKRKIRYNDVYQYSVLNNQGGSTINTILSNGISNMKKLVIVPILSAQSNVTISPLQSPLTSEPGTPTMQISLTKLNVNVSGKNVYQQNNDYDFESFMEEVRPSNNINGGLFDGLSCGLIGQLEWTNQFRYYVVDLGRRSPSEQGVPKSLQLMCQINAPTLRYVDLYCFVEFEKQLEIDCATGEVQMQ